MIVLAIAGLILAIVFIAVPALQRNSRNTQRRADLGNLRAQVETWVSNNGGKVPKTQEHYASIVGSSGWGHYNGNQPEPGLKQISVAVGGNCTPSTAGSTEADCLDATKGTPAAAGLWTFTHPGRFNNRISSRLG